MQDVSLFLYDLREINTCMKDSARLILASSSARRATLLRQLGLEFEIVPSSVQENVNGYKSPIRLVTTLAREKVNEVATRVSEGIIIGADTVVVLDEKRLGKPRDAGEAAEMLRWLSGREHCVYTAFELLHIPSRKSVSDYEITRVKFRDLSEAEIDAYVKSGSCFDKAGAYGIQDDFGAVFVERIDGCYYNVVGLPLTKFYLALQKLVNRMKQ
jgi:septum formation protein